MHRLLKSSSIFLYISLQLFLNICASAGFYGILVILATCSVQIYTAILLSRSWIIAGEINPAIHRKIRYPYAALAEVTYGRRSASYVTFLLNLTIFCAGIPNLIVGEYNTSVHVNISGMYLLLSIQKEIKSKISDLYLYRKKVINNIFWL